MDKEVKRKELSGHKIVFDEVEDVIKLLVGKYRQSVRGMDAEDLSQELRLHFWIISDKYDESRGSVVGFLRKAGDNYVKDLIRKQHFAGLFLEDDYPSDILSELSPCYGVPAVDEYVRDYTEKRRRRYYDKKRDKQ